MTLLALSDGAWAALASMVTSIVTLIAVIITHQRVGAVDNKIKTPNGDSRTIGEIVTEISQPTITQPTKDQQ